MQGTTRHRQATTPAVPEQHAVVWIEPGRAVVARRTAGAADAVVETVELRAGPLGFADVAHHVGRAAHVLILGGDDERTSLEREIVAIGHHPERIREERADGPIDLDVLLARLDRIAPAR